ncbi:MAG TPA: transaldolase family protein, partial [Pseudomonadales bacterium]|nr:transaldolase family protein [Pseudomonadales bacterium]
VNWAKAQGGTETQQIENACDKLTTLIGAEIASVIPGRVSTEVNASLSFNTAHTLHKARKLISLYEQNGIPRHKILIKIAGTWEGIRAAEILEKENIQCNLTLIFSLVQAAACAEAGAYLISPFVGRILDWYKAKFNKTDIPADEDPGVISVTRIYHYFKHFGHATKVMGASFRNSGEIEALAGCDQLTISPALLSQLDADQNSLTRRLSPNDVPACERINCSENAFRWQMNEDAMATEKLAEGIRLFHADTLKLEAKIKAYFS